jgi:exosortase/archaeosortase
VNYNMLMAPMIEAVKTLNRRIDALIAAVALLYIGLAVRLFMDMRKARSS